MLRIAERIAVCFQKTRKGTADVRGTLNRMPGINKCEPRRSS